MGVYCRVIQYIESMPNSNGAMCGRVVVDRFLQHQEKRNGNDTTDGERLMYRGNVIARWSGDGLEITDAGWATQTTKRRLNMLPGVQVVQKAGAWYLNGEKWDGSWVAIN
jgi:hypothetical protein